MMKKLLSTFSMMLIVITAFGQSCPDNNHPHAIDLGLPSGTKWACCNVGADTPENFGNYYAWGETEEKTQYTRTSYIFGKDDHTPFYDIGEDIAGSQYDVAHVKWGDSWVMPTYNQILELQQNCHAWPTEMNGIDGFLLWFNNDESIFLPAVGFRYDSEINGSGKNAYYWASTRQDDNVFNAWALYYNVSIPGYLCTNDRSYGHCVRPVMGTVNDINLLTKPDGVSNHTIYNIYGIKVADNVDNTEALPSGIYIVNGKKMFVK